MRAVDAVILDGVILSDRAKVAVSPPATLRCAMAEEVTAWLRDDIAPAALKLGAPLRGLDNFDSYECRGRNRVHGATLSEHGRANALDVRAFKLASGEEISLTDVSVGKAWRDGIRATACARFTTVLGPGSDGHHEEHIHVDLAERRSGYKICEWEVREPAALADKKERRPNRQLPHRRCRSRCRCRARGRSPPIPGATCNCAPRPARNDATRSAALCVFLMPRTLRTD